MLKRLCLFLMVMLLVAACDDTTSNGNTGGSDTSSGGGATVPDGEVATVSRVIDGDTIDVLLDGQSVRIRYVGVNTPERDEPCYSDATQANRDLVEGKQVTLVTDTTDQDRFGRSLRYIYADDVFVNEALVRNGYAEAVLYEPDDEYYQDFLALEKSAAQSGLNCHATGIFDDGSDVR